MMRESKVPPDIQAVYERARKALAANVMRLPGYDRPVLIEGGDYQGIWLECGPHEGLVYGRFDPDIAVNNHDIFFHNQRADGYLPCWIRAHGPGSAQIQMVVPIAKTAWEVIELTGREELLPRAYAACSRFDDWLMKYRNTRGTGLCEAFCEFDTGHDNSPRFAGLPRRCPDQDARQCPAVGQLPYLAPDLSATVYGGRQALAQMAEALGKDEEARIWRERAAELRQRIIRHCFDPEDECFYDVDRAGNFVRVRGDLLTRVCCEQVPDPQLFERLYARYLHNPAEFWTPYPLPSISVGDPAFDSTCPPNAWSGASQALTALRTPRWFLHYGKEQDLHFLMRRWVAAIARCTDFMQQMDPWTGAFSTSPNYSPAMCVFIDFVDRLGTK